MVKTIARLIRYLSPIVNNIICLENSLRVLFRLVFADINQNRWPLFFFFRDPVQTVSHFSPSSWASLLITFMLPRKKNSLQIS